MSVVAPSDGSEPPAHRHVGLGGLLNVASLALVVAIVAGLSDVELLLNAFWVTLAIGAFVFTLRVALLRVALGSLFILPFFVSEAGGLAGIELQDLAEWPLLLVILILVTFMADRIRTTSQRYASLYRQASDRLVSAHEEERGRLGRDLHDSVGQTLTAVMLTLGAADAAIRAAPDAPASSAQPTISRAQALAAAALEETRRVSSQLRPPRIRENGLGAAIQDLASSAGISVDVRFDPAVLPPRLLEPEREICAYRIVQEAIGNAARHSHAEHVWVDAKVDDSAASLVVGDDGAGFRPEARRQGLGLASMQERVEILGGRLDIRSRPGAGTTIEMVIPLSTRSESDAVSRAASAAPGAAH